MHATLQYAGGKRRRAALASAFRDFLPASRIGRLRAAAETEAAKAAAATHQADRLTRHMLSFAWKSQREDSEELGFLRGAGRQTGSALCIERAASSILCPAG